MTSAYRTNGLYQTVG